ncbi:MULTISPECIES: antibiotic biosynthesis monooxygenase [Cyanophyceae]|uniref:antibiotic biosynthesis monooxygenase n=1 Tax=Cyanophyceae TaxID=3028117 RepID=UPI00168229CD|nr:MULTISPECIES: antibiotic biosynthesis monooxygenase [Cyanophyceae]MBD1918344.1 antibiotic biosynthesis monooxygenase [Phormidium sp. FACHB-77]MBD2028787.1 antibiotic biosynthesis monooxygenase [Phormidium sp. FACHB-322]MBD2051208.1 antibiotic biosynthesis monooxygenase [Leptolyngbya sp. FACHB-60]
MLTVFKDNSVLAGLDIFVTQPDQQWILIDELIAYTHDILKQQSGYIANAIHRSLDGLKVVNYVQWQNQASYQAYINNRNIALATKITGFFAPDSHLYDIFMSEPADSQMQIRMNMPELVNFGIFRLKNPPDQPRFLESTAEAIQQISGQSGLITTHFHRSLDGARAINYGLWNSQELYAKMNANPPMAEPLQVMRSLANNEFQMSLHQVVFTESANS